MSHVAKIFPNNLIMKLLQNLMSKINYVLVEFYATYDKMILNPWYI